MQTDPADRRPASLAETLEATLVSQDPRGPAIGDITAAVGEKGFGVLLMVLSLPSALPVPAPGYSTPFGIAIAIVALQMMVGRRRVWLPRRIRAARVQPAAARRMAAASTGFLRRIERLVRPRQRWIRGRSGQSALATVILVMACLMMLPIPMTNTFPAMVIFMVGVGLSEEDGLLALGAFGVGCLAVLLYAGIIHILVTRGPEAIDAGKDWLKNLFGFGR